MTVQLFSVLWLREYSCFEMYLHWYSCMWKTGGMTRYPETTWIVLLGIFFERTYYSCKNTEPSPLYAHWFWTYLISQTCKLYLNPIFQSLQPIKNGVLDEGMMVFINPRILTWFSSSCCILTNIPSSPGTSWFWSSFQKWYRSHSLLLKVMRSRIAICTLEISGCVPDYIELTRLLILFRVALRILTSFLEDAPSFFTSIFLLSAFYDRLLA